MIIQNGSVTHSEHDGPTEDVPRPTRRRQWQRLKKPLRWLVWLLVLATLGLVAWVTYQEIRHWERQPSPENFNLQPEILGPEMVVIPGGVFTMGSPDSEAGRSNDEGPQHSVKVVSFALGRYEVTFDEYDVFAKATGRKPPNDEGWGRGLRPVINVSWDDALAYAAWLSQKTGQHYRLPTEAEWEYVARAGTTASRYWGDEPKLACNYANVRDKYFDCDDGYADKTAPVGSFIANPFGLQDMLGNVWEWVADCWHDSYQGAPVDGSDWEDGKACESGGRVLRGGSWYSIPGLVRSAFRGRYNPAYRYYFNGFRLARTL